jgi:hypothetical protein
MKAFGNFDNAEPSQKPKNQTSGGEQEKHYQTESQRQKQVKFIVGAVHLFLCAVCLNALKKLK